MTVTATVIPTTQLSAVKYPHTHEYRPMSSPSTPLSTTRVNTARQNKRPSVRLKIARGKSNIVNSVVVDAAGHSLYAISSNLKRTTVVACKNNVEVATVEWDRSSPQLVLRRKKLRCKEWLPLAGPQTEYKPFLLTAFCYSELEREPLPGLAYLHMVTRNLLGRIGRPPVVTYVSATTWTPFLRELIDPLQLIPANRPGLAVARWRIRSHSDDLELEIFHEALVEPGLLEAIVLSVLLLRSGRSLGDTIEAMSFWDPNFLGPTLRSIV